MGYRASLYSSRIGLCCHPQATGHQQKPRQEVARLGITPPGSVFVASQEPQRKRCGISVYSDVLKEKDFTVKPKILFSLLYIRGHIFIFITNRDVPMQWTCGEVLNIRTWRNIFLKATNRRRLTDVGHYRWYLHLEPPLSNCCVHLCWLVRGGANQRLRQSCNYEVGEWLQSALLGKV